VAVLDGDTIVVEVTVEVEDEETVEERIVRLAGIEAPEVDGDDAATCFGDEARERLDTMLPRGRTVYLEQPNDAETNTGRAIVYVWFKGATNGRPYLANDILLRGGYARVATVPQAAVAKYRVRLRDAQAAARDAGDGLWSACADIGASIEPADDAGRDVDPVREDRNVGPISGGTGDQLDDYWDERLEEEGVDYVPPTALVGFDRPVDSACGLVDENVGPAAYCALDNTIYYAVPFAVLIVDNFGEYAWVYVIAHEWGHHVQGQLGLLSSLDYNIEIELQADCLAGTFAGNAEGEDIPTEEDLSAAFFLASLGGDPAGTEFDDLRAHGTSEQRTDAFALGLDGGLDACMDDLQSIGIEP
jgi:endonuclease YncB( thermonuclease family)